MKVGDWARAEREGPSRGTWRRHAGRVGRVVERNLRDGELGLRFTAHGEEHTVWFKLNELIPVAKPRNAPNITLPSERAAVSDAPEKPLLRAAA